MLFNPTGPGPGQDTRASPRGELELISRAAVSGRQPISVLFVHGINVGAWVWEDHFLDHFAEAGFSAYAMNLRGHERSWGAQGIREWTLADYVDDLAEAT